MMAIASRHSGHAPMVSVLMAVHNGLGYLPEAVNSILAQTFGDFEFIIVDDGSTDGSREWLEGKAREDARIRLAHQERQGLTKALNRGLAMARGRYVARMDADDIALPDRFAAQVEVMEAEPGLVVLGSEVELITAEGVPFGPRRHMRDHAGIRKRLLGGDGGAMTHPSVMMRRDAVEAVGGYDETFVTTQDLDLFLRLSEVGEVRNLGRILLHWRQHPASINRTRSETWMTMKRLAIRRTIERIGAEAYANELFPRPEHWALPDTTLQYARIAEARGRFVPAFRLAIKGMRTKGEQLPSLLLAFRLMVQAIPRKVRYWVGYLR